MKWYTYVLEILYSPGVSLYRSCFIFNPNEKAGVCFKFAFSGW